MNFSIILPSRGRPGMLSLLCKSIDINSSRLSALEMLVGYDFDDKQTINEIPRLSESYHWLKFMGRERGASISRDYQNWMYRQCSGKYIFLLNDDVEIKTKNWDEIALAKMEKYLATRPDGIAYGWVNDSETMCRFGNPDSPYSCFPMLTRKAIDVLGYAMHEYYGGWGADVHLYRVYNAVNRVTDLSEVVASHNSPWLHKRDNDDTNWSMRDKSANKEQIDISEDVAKLARIIREPILL